MSSLHESNHRPLSANDLVIRDLADSEADLRARVDDLEADNRILRDVAHEAIHHLRRRNVEADRSQSRIIALIAELRVARADAQSFAAQLRQLQEFAA